MQQTDIKSCFLCKFFKDCYPDIKPEQIDYWLLAGGIDFRKKIEECNKYEFDIDWINEPSHHRK